MRPAFLCLAAVFTVCANAQTPYVAIDSPVANSIVVGTAKVYGWSIDNTATIGPIVSGVTVQANGPTNPFSGAGYGIALYDGGYTNAYRPDVCTVYPGRAGCPYVGYETDMAASSFSAGSYSFAVTASAAGQPNGSSTVSNVYVEPVVGPTNSLVSPNPPSGQGVSATFTFAVNSTNAPPDGTDVGTVWILFNTPAGGVNGANSCYFSLTPSSNFVQLVNDAGNLWAYSGNIGGGSIANSQCSINLGQSSSSYNAATHTLNMSFAITFQADTYGTTQNVWMDSFQQLSGGNLGWQSLGLSWTVASTQPVSVTIATTPSGLAITADGANYTSPYTFSWIPGAQHTIGVTSPQTSGGLQYQFSGWSDVGAQTHSITVPSGGGTYTASFTTQSPNIQTITSSPSGLSLVVDGSVCASPCPFNTWVAGSAHTVFATIAQNWNGGQYLFSYWSDGWPASHQVTAGASSTTYTAYFNHRTTVSGGISPAALEVNLGSVGFDYYDGVTPNSAAGHNFVACTNYITVPNPIYQACMQYLLSNYAIQGVTGVRFQFNTMASPSTALTGPGSVSPTWKTRISNFFNDLAAFGISNITPTPSWDDGSAAYQPSGGPAPACYPLLNQTTCSPQTTQAPCTTQSGLNGSLVEFSPLLPYGVNVDTIQNAPPLYSFPADGYLDNQGYSCSPANPNFWGWSSHYALLSAMASAARTAGLNIEEIDLENEVDLVDFIVQARLVYDNITGTAVFKYLGQALSQNGYNAAAVTVSVDTNSPADLTNELFPYPCASVYGDAAQVLPSSELVAAVGGYQIGIPWGGSQNGSMLCGGSPNDPNTGKPWMQFIPSQGSSPPAVVDMHAKPCMQIGSNGNYTCDYTNSQNSSANQTQAAQDTWSMAWDFVYYRYLYYGFPQPATIFGETWSNSNKSCNGNADASLTQSTVSGYQQSCLSGNTACFGANTLAGVNPNPSSVVFRPWGDANWPASQCETPLNIGAPTAVTSGGPYKQ